MKKLLVLVAILAILLVATIAPAGAAGDDTLMVLFKGNGVPAGFANKIAALGGEVTFSHEIGFAVVKGVSSLDVKKISKVSDVIPNFQFDMAPVPFTDAVAVEALPASPDDPTLAGRFAWQWNMRAIDAPEAWAEGYLGSPDVTVAILDTGIGYTHADLAGLVDLSRSKSFVPDDDVYVEYYFPGANLIADIGYHGTHVAATVASNGIAAAGVTSKTTLMGVKVCSVALGYCPGDAIFSGILYAVDQGADVVNMSLGGAYFKKDYPGEQALTHKIFNYARSKGVTIVVSAGNEALDLDHTPNLYSDFCDNPAVVCVSATGPTDSVDFYFGPWVDVDAPASYTNFGRSAISVAAPGGDWWTDEYNVDHGAAVWAACSTFSLVIPDCQTGTYVVGLAGTSMAAPHVSGLAALLVDQYGANPGVIKTKLQQGAEDLGLNGTDPFYGKGRINVFDTVVP